LPKLPRLPKFIGELDNFGNAGNFGDFGNARFATAILAMHASEGLPDAQVHAEAA
jgi:hypothetical protein